MTHPVYLFLFLPPFLALGWVCLRAGRSELALAAASKKWPAISGTVQSLTPLHVGNYTHSWQKLRQQLYVRYHFEVGAQRYWGAWKSPPARTLETAMRKCGLQESGPVTIYYCPEDPRTSVVVRGLTLERAMLTLAGAAFIVFPSLLVAIVFVALSAT